jgi:N-terminal acetyltransferase B complex non-catalytic subunit
LGIVLIQIADILLALYARLWETHPDNLELGQQVLLISTALWDTPTMCASSRKMFNMTKTTTWARVAAWAEWIDVSFSYLIIALSTHRG